MKSGRSTCPACLGRRVNIAETISISRLRAVWRQHYPAVADRLRGYGNRKIRMLECTDCAFEWTRSSIAADARLYGLVPSGSPLRWEYDVVLRRLPARAIVIDLGCGEGHFLERARFHGVTAIGYDTCEAAVQVARSKGLVAVHGGVWEALAIARRSPHRFAVVAFHLIEHLVDIEAFGDALAGAQEVHLSFPNPDRWTKYFLPTWLAGEHEMWNYPPWHQSRWSAHAIELYARRFGFSVRFAAAEPPKVREIARSWMHEMRDPVGATTTRVKARLAELSARGLAVGGRSYYAHLLRNAAVRGTARSPSAPLALR
jgi:2-polyprenyl-3-methyl-5-hydroxy-6-metoxy-1,4-benzoquinol methylase